MAGADVAGVTSQINLVHALLLHLRGSFCTVRFRFVYRGSLVPRGASMQTVTRPEAAQPAAASLTVTSPAMDPAAMDPARVESTDRDSAAAASAAPVSPAPVVSAPPAAPVVPAVPTVPAAALSRAALSQPSLSAGGVASWREWAVPGDVHQPAFEP